MTFGTEGRDAEAATIELRFLGGFGIRSGCGGWQSGPTPKKGGGFIRYLGIYPRRVATREDLAAAFWPGTDVDEVAHRIHLAASGARIFLRELLAGVDAVRCNESGYVWNPSIRVVSDAQRFMEDVRSGTSESLRAAINIYAGDFLAGEKADWIQPMRVKLASARASALEAIVEDLFERKRYTEALGFALDLVDADRGHESGTRQVMRCFAAQGQPTRAIEQYNILKSYLAEQIGVEPTDETSSLAANIVAPKVGTRRSA